MEINDNPIISCLCIADCDLEHISKSIKNFEQQTYKSKELIVVYDNSRSDIEELSKKSCKNSITFISVLDCEDLSTASLKKIALSAAKGNFFCIWSCLDWHNPKRLEVQLRSILSSHKSCSIIFQHLVYFHSTRNLYASPRRPLEKSLVCSVNYFKDNCKFYDELQECSGLIDDLIDQNSIVPVSDPTLYIENGLSDCEYGKFLPGILLQFSQKMDDLSFEDVSTIISCCPEVDEVESIFKRRIEQHVRLIQVLPKNAKAISRSV